MLNIGLCHQIEGNYMAALDEYKRALGIKERVLGKHHLDTVDILMTIGLLHNQIGMDDVALAHYETGLRIGTRVYGEKHFSIANILINIGMTYLRLGRYDEALNWYQQALDVKPFCPITVAEATTGIAVAFSCLRLYDKALHLYNSALRIKRSIFGDNHIITAATTMNIGITLLHRGDTTPAEKQVRRGYKILKATLGKEHSYTLKAKSLLDEVCRGNKGKIRKTHVKKWGRVLRAMVRDLT